MYKLRKTVQISASHYLVLPYDSPCENMHGHNYYVTVYLHAEKLNSEGMVMDFALLKKAVMKFDHQNLNDYMGQPTAEHFARLIHEEVNVAIESLHAVCYRVAVEETKGSVAIYEL